MSIIEKFDPCLLATSSVAPLLFELFAPISLDDLNQKASMLTRLDNKYIVRKPVLKQALPSLAKHFDILEIEQKRIFHYDTCYFDDELLSCYFNHHNGRRQRIKVRTRKYSDAGLCFIEAKIKDIRGITVKKRIACDPDRHGAIDQGARDYIANLYRDFYQKDFDLTLQPQLHMSYQRITLVAKQGHERLTLDTNIRFVKNGRVSSLAEDIFIVESKSRNGNGQADALLRSLHQHPSKGCSKYCLGLCITQGVEKINNFMPALRKLGVLAGSHILESDRE
ncbi:MAG TPA: polyphosphate polymerase domain-containing protein [Cellvibrio sp.]|nr:polyphosphate polymerase domain-containing protein [Cellvibrio sp.]